MSSPGGDITPQGDPPEEAPVYSIFLGMKRTPPRTTGGLNRKVKTPSKRVHSPEENSKNKREKLLVDTPVRKKSLDNVEVEAGSLQRATTFAKDRREKLQIHASVKQQCPIKPSVETAKHQRLDTDIHGKGTTPLQELNCILEDLAVLTQKPVDSKSAMRKLIMAAQEIVRKFEKERRTVDTGTSTDHPRELRRWEWKDRVESGTPRDQWATLCGENWPPEAYQRTLIVGPEPINQPSTTSLIVTRRGQLTAPEGDHLLKQIPALTRLDHNSVPDLLTISSTETIEGIESSNSRVFLMSLDERAGTEEILTAFEALRQKIEGFNDRIIVKSLIIEGAVVRKAIELAFSGTGVTWALTTDQKRRKTSTSETLVITAGGMTYADLVKSCKEKVDSEELGVRVLTYKQNLTGNLEMRVSGKVSALKERIQEQVPGAQMTARKKTSTMHIKDLEEEVTRDEIIAGIKKSMKDETLEPIVTSIRPAYDNTCRATVKVESKAAESLARKGFVQIGLISAKIWIREEKPRCFKCKEEGHLKGDCTGEYKPNTCFKCKQAGHIKANCPDKHFKNE